MGAHEVTVGTSALKKTHMSEDGEEKRFIELKSRATVV